MKSICLEMIRWHDIWWHNICIIRSQTVKTEEIPQTNRPYGIVNFERRKYPRFDVNLPLEYVRSDMSVNLGRAVNASQGGLLISIQDKMEVGQTLKITLFLLPGTELVSVKAKGEIVWVMSWVASPIGEGSFKEPRL